MIKNSKDGGAEFLVQSEFCCGNDEYTIVGMKYCPGGELYTRLKTLKNSKDGITKEMQKFYAANILLGLAQLHKLGIIYKE